MSTRKLAAAAALMLVIGGCASVNPGQKQVAALSGYSDAQTDSTHGAKDSVTSPN